MFGAGTGHVCVCFCVREDACMEQTTHTPTNSQQQPTTRHAIQTTTNKQKHRVTDQPSPTRLLARPPLHEQLPLQIPVPGATTPCYDPLLHPRLVCCGGHGGTVYIVGSVDCRESLKKRAHPHPTSTVSRSTNPSTNRPSSEQDINTAVALTAAFPLPHTPFLPLRRINHPTNQPINQPTH